MTRQGKSNMFTSSSDVSNLLERVMSRVPAAAPQSRAPARLEDAEAALDAKHEKQLGGIFSQTRITTNFGKVPAHLIRVGDRVKTRSGRFLPVRKIREIKLDLEFVARHPDAMPCLLRQGAIDRKYPTQDVLLAPAQIVTLVEKNAKVPTIRASDLPQIRRTVDETLGLVAYYEFVLEEVAEIYCEGVWARSAES